MKRLSCIIAIVSMASMVLATAWALAAPSERTLLVETHVARTLQAAAGVYAHHVDLDRRAPDPRPQRLPGAASLARMSGQTMDRAVVTTGSPWPGDTPTPRETATFTSILGFAPLGAVPGGEILSAEGWWQRAEGILEPDDGIPRAVVLGMRVDEYGVWRGRLDLRPITAEGQWAATGAIIRPLPGVPVAAAPLDDDRQLAVLSYSPNMTGAALHMLDIDSGRLVPQVWEVAPETDGAANFEPAGIWYDAAAARITLAAWGYWAADPAASPATWIYTLDDTTFEPIGPPARLPSRIEPHAHAVAPTGAGAYWIATREPGTDHVNLTELAIAETGPTPTHRIPIFGEIDPVRLRYASETNTLYVAAGSRLQAYRNGEPFGEALSFGAPIRVLTLDEEVLYVGEGPRVHRLTGTSLRIEATRRLSPGNVVSIVPLDAHETTEPPSEIRLTMPSLVQFSSVAAAREGRPIPVTAQGMTSDTVLRWRAHVDALQYPWLEVSPSEGYPPDPFTVRAWLPPNAGDLPALTGMLTIEVVDPETDALRAGPTAVHVRVLPGQAALRRILWVGNDGDGPSLMRLRDHLAARPLLASHFVAREPYTGILDAYPVVVVTLDAVERGMISRSAVLDHVEGGGGLLLLAGQPDPETAGFLNDWLFPLGLQTEPTQPVSGIFTPTEPGPLTEAWDGFSLDSGVDLRVVDPEGISDAVAGDTENSVVFAAGTYGHGRFAVLAAPTPLADEAFDGSASRRFATNVFRWLL